MTLINGTIIRKPVSQRDIQGALGLSSSVNKWSQLCMHGNINKWAKYKPLRHSTPAKITDKQRKDLNYGITSIPVWTGSGSVNSMGNFWFEVDKSSTNYPECGIQTEYWAYQRPIGGVSSPFRELDFVSNDNDVYGYKHDVSAPIGGCVDSTLYISAAGSLKIEFSGNGSEQTGGYAVPLSELTGIGVATGMFGNMYMSVMIRKVGSSIYYVASRDNKWSDDNSTSVTRNVTEAIGNALSGSCEVFPFLSTTKFESFTSNLSGERYPVVAMYDVSAVNVVIQKAKAEPSLFNAWYVNASDKMLHASFTLTNTGDADFRAKYTVSFSKYDTFPDTDTVTVTGEIFINKGTSADCSVSPNIWISDTAKYYRNGYARLIVTIASGYGIIFYESTSAAAMIIWQNDPTPRPYD